MAFAPHEVARMTNPLKTLPPDVLEHAREYASDVFEPQPIAKKIKSLTFTHRLPSGCECYIFDSASEHHSLPLGS